jgi:hypothetical protein
MNLVKIISSVKSGGYQLAKFLRFGDKDVQEKKTVSPYGVDSNPIADMIALYAETTTKGEAVLVGYINKNAIAAPGELRFFGTNESGTEMCYQWFRTTGKVEINGDEDNIVRFTALKAGFDQLKADHNDLVSKWNSFCNTYIPGSPTVQGKPLTAVSLVDTASTASIDGSKVLSVLTTRDN